MPLNSDQGPMTNGVSPVMPITSMPSSFAMDLSESSWHWHPPSASPLNAAGWNASTTLLPLREESDLVSKPAPMSVKSGAASPTEMTA